MKSHGNQLLAEWCLTNDITSADLARRVQDAAHKLDGVRKTERPSYGAAKRWIRGTWRPQYDTRLAIEEATDGYVPVNSWLEEPE